MPACHGCLTAKYHSKICCVVLPQATPGSMQHALSISVMPLQEDGDQSSKSCKQRNDQAIRNSMARVGEMFPYHLAREPNQPLIRALCDFDLAKLQSIFKPEWLSYRATPNHLPVTSLVVSLAQRTTAPKADAIPKYVTILEWLVNEGARVDARDIGGYTALAHAAAHTPVLPLAEVLLGNGANVNYQNRFGAAVLMSAVMAGEVGNGALCCEHFLYDPIILPSAPQHHCGTFSLVHRAANTLHRSFYTSNCIWTQQHLCSGGHALHNSVKYGRCIMHAASFARCMHWAMPMRQTHARMEQSMIVGEVCPAQLMLTCRQKQWIFC